MPAFALDRSLPGDARELRAEPIPKQRAVHGRGGDRVCRRGISVLRRAEFHALVGTLMKIPLAMKMSAATNCSETQP